jgi:hypothetical protein
MRLAAALTSLRTECGTHAGRNPQTSLNQLSYTPASTRRAGDDWPGEVA